MSVLDWKSYVVALPENAQIPMDKYIENPSRSARIPNGHFPNRFPNKNLCREIHQELPTDLVRSVGNYRPITFSVTVYMNN